MKASLYRSKGQRAGTRAFVGTHASWLFNAVGNHVVGSKLRENDRRAWMGRCAMRSRRVLSWATRFLFVTGGLAVLYVASTLLHAGFYQEIASNTLDQQIHAEEQQEVSMPPAAANEGDVLGRIEIPRLAVRVAILEGTTP
jgi:hypothetical protein